MDTICLRSLETIYRLYPVASDPKRWGISKPVIIQLYISAPVMTVAGAFSSLFQFIPTRVCYFVSLCANAIKPPGPRGLPGHAQPDESIGTPST